VTTTDGEQPVFYYDLGSPACYLAAELIMAELPVVPEWVPVPASEVGEADFEHERELVGLIAPKLDLQPLRWPVSLSSDGRDALLAATYARHIGRGVSFSIACFRQVFAGGRDIGDHDTILIAAAACEMHPAAVLKGIGLRSVADGLEQAVARARAEHIAGLPALRIGPATFEGLLAIERATGELEVRR
jgi:2-hydroxychromene-2-carboxylate isomerase